MDQAGIELTTSRLRQLRQLPVVQHVRFTPLKSRQKTQLQWRARGCTGQLTTCLECTWCQFQHLCVLILNCALALAIYIFVGLIFDALAQGNAYKPTKEPINYRGPGGDRTHDLQTEATPPAASCPARTLHATEIAPKNATPMTCPWLHWTTDNLSGMHMVSISTPVCVNFELRPGAGDIHICWFNFWHCWTLSHCCRCLST